VSAVYIFLALGIGLIQDAAVKDDVNVTTRSAKRLCNRAIVAVRLGTLAEGNPYPVVSGLCNPCRHTDWSTGAPSACVNEICRSRT